MTDPSSPGEPLAPRRVPGEPEAGAPEPGARAIGEEGFGSQGPGERVASWWPGAVAGMVCAACGLAVAELVTGFASTLRSPIVSVSDRVIDSSPPALKTWAIDTFGTNDKAVLLGVVAVLLALFAAGIGIVAVRRSIAAGLAGVATFAGVGAAASLGRGGGGLAAVIPSVIGGLVAGAVLVLLAQRVARFAPAAGPNLAAAPGGPGGPGGSEPAVADIARHTESVRALWEREHTASRRQFLGASGLLLLGAAVVGGAGRWLQQRGVAAAERLKVALPAPTAPAPPVPVGAGLNVEGLAPFITPNADFYRIDTALSVPQVDPRDWTLKVMGDVERPITLTYAELLERPMVEVDITLACVSNEVGGDLVGNARWLGCRLDDLLAEAGIAPGADQIVGRSVDGFTAGFPTALLDGRDALVAVGMNGEPLPILHGFPARLVVPGVYGYVSATKWLSEIQLTNFADFEGYWVPRGWAVEGPIKTQSRIDTPTRSGSLSAGRIPVAGVAWAPTRGISKVEVQVDDGPWNEAELGDEYTDTTWRQWVWAWDAEPGEHRLQVRATDGDGVTQTDVRTRVAPDGASGWHSVDVTVS